MNLLTDTKNEEEAGASIDHESAASAYNPTSSLGTGICKSDAPPFHPLQLLSEATRPDAPQQRPEPLQLKTPQSNFIDDTLKIKPEQRESKRQKIGDGLDYEPPTESSLARGNDDFGICCELDLLNDLDAHPHVIRVVATSTGLITGWNEEFTKITKPSTFLKKKPLTIFELVHPKSLPSLHSMLALSADNVRIGGVGDFSSDDQKEARSARSEVVVREDEKSTPSSSHLSMTLPCIPFRSFTRYNITLVFMNDTESMKSFLGIITPRHSEGDDSLCHSFGSIICLSAQASSNQSKDSATASTELQSVGTAVPSPLSPHGRILRISDELLCRTLLGHCNRPVLLGSCDNVE